MRRHVGFAALSALIALTPALAHARGYGGKGGSVMTPFGPVYNTSSPEWKMSGGNPMVYEQIMEQKMMMMQQQAMQKQQQLLLKQQQQKKGPGATVPGTGAGAASGMLTTLPRTKKKRRTYMGSHVVSPANAVTGAKVDATKGATKTDATTKAAPIVDAAKTPAKP